MTTGAKDRSQELLYEAFAIIRWPLFGVAGVSFAAKAAATFR